VAESVYRPACAGQVDAGTEGRREFFPAFLEFGDPEEEGWGLALEDEGSGGEAVADGIYQRDEAAIGIPGGVRFGVAVVASRLRLQF
jgi:hypothetical protein